MKLARFVRGTFATLMFAFPAVALAGLMASTGGCEVLVGETIPSNVACTGDLPGICPDGYFCSNGTCAACAVGGCGVLLDAGHETGPVDAHVVVDTGHDVGHEATTPPIDAGHDATTMGAIGDSCSDNAGCGVGLTCVPGTDLNGLSLTSTSVCSKPCCADSDCGGGSVGCYPTTGGNLCVTSRALQTCGTTCGKPCCASTDCAASGGDSSFCSIGTTAAGTTPSCQPFSGDTQCSGDPGCVGATGDPCGVDSDCESGLCVSVEQGQDCTGAFADCVCFAPVTCCNDQACASTGAGDTCQWLETNDATNQEVVFRGCQSPPGNKESGQSCTDETTCKGAACEQFPGEAGKLCTQPCCQDSDCTGIGTNASGQWLCRPFVQSLGVGNLAILICQPPAG